MVEVFSTAYLMGGLGNQMFQISNAYAQSLDGGVKCYFNKTSKTELQGKTTDKYVKNIFSKLIFKENLPKTKRFNEESFSYSIKKFDWTESIKFYGYYQSSKNFLTFSDQIIQLFSPNEDSIEYIKNKYPQILDKETLSLHIRLGDYKKFPNIHPIISMSYIEESIKKINNYSHIFVFSDDKNWVRKNIKFDNIVHVNEDDYLEMWLMSMCQNNIISNSSFSWWGSYLNNNKTKKVIAPSVWFGKDGPKNFGDIYEDSWIKINC